MDYITLNELVEYQGINAIKAEDAMRFIHSSSRHIDALTYGRITKYGFENLTEFQQNVIKESTAALAKFEYDNDDLINSPLDGYSINGVTVQFSTDSNRITRRNGVIVKTEIFNLLSLSGLTTTSFRV